MPKSAVVALILALVCTGCGDQRGAASSSPSSLPQAAPAPSLTTVVIGQWTWSNDRKNFLLDAKIPVKYREGSQAQAVRFEPNGRVLLSVKHSVSPDAPFEGGWGGTWVLDPNREQSVIVTLDPIPESPGPHLGIKGKMTVYYKLEQLAGSWFLVRPIDDGYLTFFKQAP